MISPKTATLSFLEIKLFWNKSYDVIIFVLDLTERNLSRNSSYIVDLVMWPKFGSSSISAREAIITSILSGFDQKTHFFQVWSWLKFNNLGLALGTDLKFYISVSALKIRKFYGLIATFVEVTREKQVRGPFCHPPSLAPTSVGVNVWPLVLHHSYHVLL